MEQRILTFNNEIDGTQWDGMTDAVLRAGEAVNRFGQQITALTAAGAVIKVLSGAFSGLDAAIRKALAGNTLYQQTLKGLKNALTEAFWPIYDFVMPGLIAMMRILTAVAEFVAKLFGWLTGGAPSVDRQTTSLDKQAKSIKTVGKAAREAKKDLAEFDQIHRLGNDSPEAVPDTFAGSGTKGKMGDFDLQPYKDKIDALTVYISGALLGLGALLAFSGVNIPLGLSLMAVGALGIASVIQGRWGTLSEEVRQSVTEIFAIVGGATLALGAVLAFSGVNVPLGMGLMAAGGAVLGSAAALNWSTIVSALQGPMGQIAALASGALLALGLILVCSGVGLPLGIGLILAGAAGLVTVGALNWNALPERLQEMWNSITQWFRAKVQPFLTLKFWQEKFTAMADALKNKIRDGVNAGIALFNKFISWVNSKMKISWPSVTIGGYQIISGGSMQLLTIPSIPALAKGAVLPANKPFLAMVGDQKSGTNVEAPLETIQQALAQVLSGYTPDVNITFTGDLAQLARVLKPAMDTETRRIGSNLAMKGGSL